MSLLFLQYLIRSTAPLAKCLKNNSFFAVDIVRWMLYSKYMMKREDNMTIKIHDTAKVQGDARVLDYAHGLECQCNRCNTKSEDDMKVDYTKAHVHGHGQKCPSCDTKSTENVSDRLYAYLSDSTRVEPLGEHLTQLLIDAYLEIVSLRLENETLKDQLKDTRWALTNARDEVNRLSDYERN